MSDPIPNRTSIPTLKSAALPYLRNNPARRYDVLESSPITHLYAPIALVLFGTAAVLWRLTNVRDFHMTFVSALRITGYTLAWNVIVMLIGVWMVAKLIGSGFGHVSTALIRLAAIAIAPIGVAALIGLASPTLIGALLGWLACIAAYWILFWWLFDLDPQETSIAVGVTTVMRWMSYLLYWIALSRFLPSPF